MLKSCEQQVTTLKAKHSNSMTKQYLTAALETDSAQKPEWDCWLKEAVFTVQLDLRPLNLCSEFLRTFYMENFAKIKVLDLIHRIRRKASTHVQNFVTKNASKAGHLRNFLR